MMSFSRSCRHFCFAAGLVSALAALPSAMFAQQVTYYDFDEPQSTPGQTAFQCSPAANPSLLFCFNDGTGLASSPSYFSDTYPAIIDPNTADNPPVQSTHYTVQVTPAAQTQASSMWFAVPQKVSSGFTAYFTFKFTPNAQSYATADGIAFVIQNSTGGGAAGPCNEIGSGPRAVGGNGGCMGYGGIDNSLAIEFDTYHNSWDPQDNPDNYYNDNHIAIQNCGAGMANSPDHTGTCQVQLNSGTTPLPAIVSNPQGITLADGNIHQVVITYSGPNEATPNLLQVFIDPPFNPGTHTPSAAAVPVLSGTYNIAANLNLQNSATGVQPASYDSAYVGFTSATGAAFEQHELMNWTFTPHTTVTQEQPIAPANTPTVFPFGAHVYATTYPANTNSPTDGISQVVTANTIAPQLFAQLVAGGPFTGSQCQVYDETGGNCIVYSISCVNTATNVFVPCPTTDQADPITVKSAYNDSTTAVTPGYLQGDPFYNLVSTIIGDGVGTATVTCAGECSVTTGQVITIAGSQANNAPSGFNGQVTVLFADPNVPNVFTFSSTVSGTATGGYLTSSNVQNIFSSYSPLRIDATTTGKTHSFSDFVVTSITSAATNLTIQAPSGVVYGQAASVTVTASNPNGAPTGSVLLTVDNSPALTQTLTPGTSNSTATFNLTGLGAGVHTLSVSYPTTGYFLAGTATGSLTIGKATPMVTLAFGSYYGSPNTYGEAAYITASISSNTGNLGSISGLGACIFGPSAITSNSAPINISYTGVGLCTVTASWPADTNNFASSGTISTSVLRNPGANFFLIAAPSTTSIGSPVNVNAYFLVSGGPAPALAPVGGTITVSTNVAGDPSCTFAAPSGNCSLTFTTPGLRTLSGQYSGSTDFLPNTSISPYATVNVTGPIATLSTTSINFGTLYVGGIGLQSVTLTNSGSAPMKVNLPLLFDVGNGDSKNFIALSLCPSTLKAGSSCSIYIAFIAGPTYNAPQTAILKVMDNAPGNPQQVSLTANVINPVASYSPRSVNFGTGSVGTTTKSSITLTNSGATPLTISSIGVKGSNPGDFAQTNNCPASLAANASCSVSVTFTPTKTGSRSAYVYVVDNMQNGSQQVGLSGTGK